MLDIQHYKGDSWNLQAVINDCDNEPVDLTGASVKIQIRKKSGDPVLFELSTDDGITIGGDDNNTLSWNRVVDLPQGIYKWDLQIIFLDTTVRTIFTGQFKIQSDITE